MAINREGYFLYRCKVDYFCVESNIESVYLMDVSGIKLIDQNITPPSFTGAAEAVAAIEERHNLGKQANKQLLELMPQSIKTISKMSKYTGEVPNIIINALGTGLIAPIFIKYNFLSKTDEDTRTYSAMRQPISAILAVLTQAAMVIPFNNVINNMCNKGRLFDAPYNKTAFPDVDFIKKELKRGNKNLSDKEAEALANKQHMANLKKMVQGAYENNTIEYTVNGKKQQLSPEEVKKTLQETAEDMLKNVNKILKCHEEEKPGKQIQRAEFIRKNNADVKKALSEIEQEIASGKDYKALSKWFQTKIKSLQKEKADSELIDIITEISQRPDVATISAKVKNVAEKCTEFGSCKSIDDVGAKVLAKIAKENAALQEEKAAILEMIKEIKDSKSVPNIAKIAEIAKRVPDCHFVYDVVQKHISNVKANIKGLKQITGLGVSLAILPLTCGLLNYLYPRIMKVLFPSLSAKKSEHKPSDTFEKTDGKPPEIPPEALQAMATDKRKRGGL